jgi:hypothetical protein
MESFFGHDSWDLLCSEKKTMSWDSTSCSRVTYFDVVFTSTCSFGRLMHMAFLFHVTQHSQDALISTGALCFLRDETFHIFSRHLFCSSRLLWRGSLFIITFVQNKRKKFLDCFLHFFSLRCPSRNFFSTLLHILLEALFNYILERDGYFEISLQSFDLWTLFPLK